MGLVTKVAVMVGSVMVNKSTSLNMVLISVNEENYNIMLVVAIVDIINVHKDNSSESK